MMQFFAWYLFTFAIVATSTLVMQIGVEIFLPETPKPGYPMARFIGTILIGFLAAFAWAGWWKRKDGDE